MRILLASLLLLLATLRAPALDTNNLPPLTNLLARAVARADYEDENDYQFGRHYHYERVRITEYRNEKGELKKTESKRSDEGVDLNAKNPPPLPAAFTNKLGKTIQAKGTTPSISVATRGPGGSSADGQTTVRGKAVSMEDFSDSLIHRFDYTLLGRETNNGRATLVLDFKPKAGKLPEKNLKDKFINKAAGRAWIDEEEAAVVRCQLHLTERVTVFGGLVGAVNQFEYSFDRTRTPDGWWYAPRVDWHFEGREVFLNRIIDYHEQKTNSVKVFDASR